jgi:hypothetical protein
MQLRYVKGRLALLILGKPVWVPRIFSGVKWSNGLGDTIVRECEGLTALRIGLPFAVCNDERWGRNK